MFNGAGLSTPFYANVASLAPSPGKMLNYAAGARFFSAHFSGGSIVVGALGRVLGMSAS